MCLDNDMPHAIILKFNALNYVLASNKKPHVNATNILLMNNRLGLCLVCSFKSSSFL